MAHEWLHGHLYWNELMTRDAEKAKKFYGGAIGWTFEAMAMPDGTYWIAKMGNAYVGGLFALTIGRIAILTEPGGAGIGWMTPAKA